MTTYRAELLRYVNRTTIAFTVLCILFTLFAMSNAGPQGQDPLWGFRQVAILTATLLMGRAAVISANDFSTGTIRPWLISRPSRRSVFTGKLGASVSYALIAAVIIAAISYLGSGVFGTTPGFAGMAVATGQFALACAALTIFGHAVGVLTRSVPAAVAITVAWILPVEKVLQGRSRTLDQWLPGNLLQDITLGQVGAGQTAGGAILHATIPFILLDVVALVVFARRDVNS
ncbi:MAG TPA: hypothetical protein VGN81_31640 [Pseudonocardiaceae bacterium]|jgi:ABC-type transport system involved in multi-copper enzyme maturation permease subunit